MKLKPSEIFYSQNSINNVFDKQCAHPYRLIGETLDDLCEERITIDSIPTITVVQKNGKWFTTDNRRLWAFRQLERLGKCREINVWKGYDIPSSKFTTYNGGTSVQVRRSPGGIWYRKRDANTYTDNHLNNLIEGDDYSRDKSRPTMHTTPLHSSYSRTDCFHNPLQIRIRKRVIKRSQSYTSGSYRNTQDYNQANSNDVPYFVLLLLFVIAILFIMYMYYYIWGTRGRVF